MYNPVVSLQKIAEKLKSKRGLKSAILPVNYPSPNKTYYQLPAWDGARLSGWVEIASKIPALIKTLYNKAFRGIKYHIEIPESHMAKRVGAEIWDKMDGTKQKAERKKLLQELDEALTGSENAFKSMVTFFEVATFETKTEYGRVKITPIEDKTNIDNDLITGSMADTQVIIAMGGNPTTSGAGKMGSGQQRSGGSDIREADLVNKADLNIERQIFLEPLYVTRDFNGWDQDIVFKMRDTILTTLDTGAGTKKTVS